MAPHDLGDGKKKKQIVLVDYRMWSIEDKDTDIQELAFAYRDGWLNDADYIAAGTH